MKQPKTVTVYIDTEYKCHTVPSDGFRGFDVYGFDGKCKAYIEGHRFVPSGERWTRPDGVVFHGEMIAPWKDFAILEAYQQQYETMLSEIQDMRTALNTMGVSIDG